MKSVWLLNCYGEERQWKRRCKEANEESRFVRKRIVITKCGKKERWGKATATGDEWKVFWLAQCAIEGIGAEEG